MIKKLLILPLIGGIMSFGAFASADDLIGNYSFTQDQERNVSIPSGVSEVYAVVNYTTGWAEQCEVMLHSSDYEYRKFFLSSYSPDDREIIDGTVVYDCSLVSSQGVCHQTPITINSYELDISDRSSDDLVFDVYCGLGDTEGNVSLYSVSSSSDDPDNGGFVPTIPDSFTSGLTSLLNNFGSTVFNWLPTIILVALGIYAIFALFRVVRNYARSSFNG